MTLSNLLVAKFRQPGLPSKYVPRPQLVARLNEGLAEGRQLTLISAPAGFGKTTCACEWLSSLNLRSVWLGLERADDDPLRFLSYFVAALQRSDAEIGSEVERVLQTGEAPANEFSATCIANDILRIAKRFVLVLDDFQCIQERVNLGLIEQLIANQPEQLHLVFVTREDPLLPLARLRANNQLTEIRAADLRFSEPEAGRLLQELVSIPLSGSDLQTLAERTEGWPAGLQLAGLSMRGRSDPSTFIAGLSGSHRFILSYLTEEVLNQQPEEIRHFLLETSILDKMNGPLCDAVRGLGEERYPLFENGDSNNPSRKTDYALRPAQEILEHLERTNLFVVPLDDEQNWYRYHHLFADLLRSQLSRGAQSDVLRLHRRASRWYREQGMIPEAIGHALEAQDYASAVDLIESNAMRVIYQGYARTVEGWMEAIPGEWRPRSPRASLAMAWAYLLSGSYARIGPYLNQVETSLASTGLAEDERGAIRGEWLALRSILASVQGQAEEGVDLAEQALRLISPENHSMLGQVYLGLGGAYRLLGDYPRLSETYQRAIRESRIAGNRVPEMLAVAALQMMAIRYGQLRLALETGAQTVAGIEREGVLPPIAATVYGMMGVVYYEWDQLEQARELFARTDALSAISGHNAGLVFAKALLARIHHAQGDLTAAGELIAEAAGLLRLGAPTWVAPEVAYQRVRTALAQRDLAAAEAAIQPFGTLTEITTEYASDLIWLSRLRISLYRAQELHEDRARQAGLELANRLAAATLESHRMGTALQALLLRARFFLALGESAACLEDLSRALEIAEPEGYLRLFIDEGPEMADLLRRVSGRVSQTAYVERLLAAFPGTQPVPEPSQGELVEPLSERELDVLRLMARGLKYEEIAAQLVISLNTVRFHVKGIYGKLGVNSRTKAIETARGLGLM